MAEFSVVIRKKDEESDSDTLSSRRKLIFYDDSSDDSLLKDREKKPKRMLKSTKPVKKIISSPQKCPVCGEILEAKIKRVYSKPASTDVYFPFLDVQENESLHTEGVNQKVKICYPCYEHLLYQWREYNMMEVPHKKRKYHDRQGVRIKTPTEIRREKEKHIAAKALEETPAAEKPNDDVIFEEEEEQVEKMKEEEKYETLYEDLMAKREEELTKREELIRMKEDELKNKLSDSKPPELASNQDNLGISASQSHPNQSNYAMEGYPTYQNPPTHDHPGNPPNIILPPHANGKQHFSNQANPEQQVNPYQGSYPLQRQPDYNNYNRGGNLGMHPNNSYPTNESLDPSRLENLLKEIRSHMERVEAQSNSSLEITKQEIEHTIQSYSKQMRRDMNELKLDNEAVRKQVMRMRKEVAELRLEMTTVANSDDKGKKYNNKHKSKSIR